MSNNDLKKAIKEAGIKQWQVATIYKGGVHETTFIKLLRRELSIEEKEMVFQAIEIAKQQFANR